MNNMAYVLKLQMSNLKTNLNYSDRERENQRERERERETGKEGRERRDMESGQFWGREAKWLYRTVLRWKAQVIKKSSKKAK